MSRLTPKREEEISALIHIGIGGSFAAVEGREILQELIELRRERDEVIVGAYRAASEIIEKRLNAQRQQETETYRDPAGGRAETIKKGEWCGSVADYELLTGIKKYILALTPQSALDAVERDRREIAETALRLVAEHQNARQAWLDSYHQKPDEEPTPPTADDVLAKVGRGR